MNYGQTNGGHLKNQSQQQQHYKEYDSMAIDPPQRSINDQTRPPNDQSQPRLDVNTKLSDYRDYILYIQPLKLGMLDGSLGKYGSDPNSLRAMELCQNLHDTVYLQDFHEVKPEERPNWLTGVPILEDNKHAQEFLKQHGRRPQGGEARIWKSRDCLLKLQELNTQPMGVSWCADAGSGFDTESGAQMGFTDSIPIGTMDASRYLGGEKKITTQSVESFEQLRTAQEKSWNRRGPPSAGEQQAILKSMEHPME